MGGLRRGFGLPPLSYNVAVGLTKVAPWQDAVHFMAQQQGDFNRGLLGRPPSEAPHSKKRRQRLAAIPLIRDRGKWQRCV